MTVEELTPDGTAARTAPRDLDWNSVYRDPLPGPSPRLYNYFRFRIGRDADVEDLTARTFEKAWKARDRYRRDLSGFSTWLFSIAQNVALEHARAPPSRPPPAVFSPLPFHHREDLPPRLPASRPPAPAARIRERCGRGHDT